MRPTFTRAILIATAVMSKRKAVSPAPLSLVRRRRAQQQQQRCIPKEHKASEARCSAVAAGCPGLVWSATATRKCLCVCAAVCVCVSWGYRVPNVGRKLRSLSLPAGRQVLASC